MAKEKKIPLRTCVSCREMKEKNELLRVVLTKEGEILPDVTGKLNGRGAYICKAESCVVKAQKSDALSRALKTSVSDNVYNLLLAEVQK